MRKIILLSMALITVVVTYSQSLNPFFAGKGYTEVNFVKGNFQFEGADQVLQKSDGTYFVLYRVNGFTVISHYFANGDRDPGFGTAGYSQSVALSDVSAALQSDGKIVVAGQSYNPKAKAYDFGLVRYNPNGFLDNTFAGDGLQTVDFLADDDLPDAMAIQPDGKILVGGQAYNPATGQSDFALARFKANGTLDASFDGDGKATIDFSNSYDAIRAISIQPNGKIAAVGESYNREIGFSRIAVARYNSDGSLDNSFSSDGKQITGFSGQDSYAYGIAVQPDGKIVLAGQVGESFVANSSIALVRYNTNGSLDNSFSGDGKVIANFFDSTDVATSIALQSDGKIVIGGYSFNPKTDGNDLVVARFNTNGTIDHTFGINGRTVTDFDGGYDELDAILVQPDDKIVAAGEVLNAEADNLDYAIVRYNSDGSLDRKFGHKGIATGYFEAADTRLNTVAVQDDGKVVVAGEAFTGKTRADFALARYNRFGSLDKSFGKDGKVTTDFFEDDDEAISLAIQPDGKIVAAGTAYKLGTFELDFVLVRYNRDGSVDKKFGKQGKVIIPFSEGNNYFGDMALQADGKIIVLGSSYDSAKDSHELVVLRYTSNGLPDNTFDGDGKVFAGFSSFDAYATSVVIQPNGKIVVLGYGFTTTTSYFILARYNGNGSLDLSFDKDGKVTTGFDAVAYRLDMALQADGKIVVAGELYNINTGESDFALARYKPDGSLDKSFDSDGKVVTDLFGVYNSGMAVAIQPDGKIVLLGSVLDTGIGLFDMSLTRYNTDGSLDKTFDDDGTLLSHVFGFDNLPSDIQIRNHKAFVAGFGFTPAQSGILASYLLGPASEVIDKQAIENLLKKILALLSVKVFPNPSAHYFSLVIQSANDKIVTIKVSDAFGRLIEAKTNVSPNTTLQLGQNYTPGVYFAEIIQGNERTVVKLVKQ